MKQFLTKTQKVTVTCILRSNDKVLLLRSDQLVNPEHQPRGGYFDVPSFTVSFGEDPEATLHNALAEYFSQSVADLCVVDIRHYMTNEATTQVFDVVYSGRCVGGIPESEKPGTFLFVALSELETYMFPPEREDLEKYL